MLWNKFFPFFFLLELNFVYVFLFWCCVMGSFCDSPLTFVATGISAEGITNLNNFYHLRKPAVNSNGVSVTRFLDSLADDSPKGCWAVTKDELTGSVTLRSLWYPGYVFTAKANSTEFSSFYSGTGQRNNDLPFML